MTEDKRTQVREKYGKAALTVLGGEKSCCCGTEAKADGGFSDPVTGELYDRVTASLPTEAVLVSLGCGNPTALAELHAGEVVLDLGSGGGIDVLLSARRVGPEGKAYGLDMTDEMLEHARASAQAAGAENVEFLKGDIESVPLPDASVNVILSNCGINLSTDKRTVLNEALRELEPGGRLAVSDIVVRGGLPEAARRSMELWMGYVATALEVDEFEALLAEAGFEDVSVEPTRVYDPEDARDSFAQAGLDVDDFADAIRGRIMAAFIRGRKPG